MSLSDAFAHIGETLKKLGADEADLLGLHDLVNGHTTEVEALKGEVAALTDEVATLKASPVGTAPAPTVDLTGLATEVDLTALTARVSTLEAGIQAIDPTALTTTTTGTPAPLAIVPTSFVAEPALGVAFDVTLAAVGGTSPYAFSIASGALPLGLSLGAGGQITGIPTMAGAWTVSVQCHDANGLVASADYSGTI